MDDVLDAMRAGLPLVCFLLLLQACAPCTPCACAPHVHVHVHVHVHRMACACAPCACACACTLRVYRMHACLRLPKAYALHGHCMRIACACLLQVAVLRRPLPQVPLPWKRSRQSANGSGGAGTSGSHAAAASTASTASAGWGLIALLLGLCTFEIGLKFGLVALGYQVSALSASSSKFW